MNETTNIDFGTPTDEFCNVCNTKLKLQRIYFNGQKICPACYSQQITENQKVKIDTKCPKCGYKIQ